LVSRDSGRESVRATHTVSRILCWLYSFGRGSWFVKVQCGRGWLGRGDKTIKSQSIAGIVGACDLRLMSVHLHVSLMLPRPKTSTPLAIPGLFFETSNHPGNVLEMTLSCSITSSRYYTCDHYSPGHDDIT
jgi:hypothetical protein